MQRGRLAYVAARRAHLQAYVSIRQHTSAYVSIRQHTSAYVSSRQQPSAYFSTRQAYVGHTSGIRTHHQPSAYVSIRQAYVSIRQAYALTTSQYLLWSSCSTSDAAAGASSAIRVSSVRFPSVTRIQPACQHTSAYATAYVSTRHASIPSLAYLAAYLA